MTYLVLAVPNGCAHIFFEQEVQWTLPMPWGAVKNAFVSQGAGKPHGVSASGVTAPRHGGL